MESNFCDLAKKKIHMGKERNGGGTYSKNTVLLTAQNVSKNYIILASFWIKITGSPFWQNWIDQEVGISMEQVHF